MSDTLFDKYGGFSKVSRIVLAFYDKMLDDDDLGPFFDDIDLPKLMDHQTKFISSLLGGPASFSDAHLVRAHRALDITDAHFDTLKILLSKTLNEFSVEPADIETIMGAIEARRELLIGDSNVD